jgi:hypothetical protein
MNILQITPTEKHTWAVFDGRPEFPHARRCSRHVLVPA